MPKRHHVFLCFTADKAPLSSSAYQHQNLDNKLQVGLSAETDSARRCPACYAAPSVSACVFPALESWTLTWLCEFSLSWICTPLDIAMLQLSQCNKRLKPLTSDLLSLDNVKACDCCHLISALDVQQEVGMSSTMIPFRDFRLSNIQHCCTCISNCRIDLLSLWSCFQTHLNVLLHHLCYSCNSASFGHKSAAYTFEKLELL